MSTRIPALDSMRGIAILMVILCHLEHHLDQLYGVSSKFFASGWNGVYLFFVLSGYLITRSLSGYSFKNNLSKYYLKRVLRTWPLYYFVLLLYLVLDHPIENLFYYLTFTMNFLDKIDPIHFWTIAVEEQIYLAYPLLAIFFRKGWKFTALIFITVFLRTFTGDAKFILVALDSFLLGCFVSQLERRNFDVVKYWLGKLRFLLIPLALMIIYVPIVTGFFGTKMTTFLYFMQAVGFSLILSLVVFTDLRNHWILQNNWLQIIGRSSYSTYLIHPLYLLYLFKIPGITLFEFIFSFIIIQIAATYLLYEYFERPLLSLGKKITYSKQLL